MNKLKLLSLLAGVCVLGCTSEETSLKTAYLDLPETPYTYQVGANNHVATLGRVLFYDNQLSINNSVSCATCHKQASAFADNVQFSRGFENRFTKRNSMPIQNLSPGFSIGLFNDLANNKLTLATNTTTVDPALINFAGSGGTFLFWDGRETNLETMVLKPIGNHLEMGIRDMKDLETKLSGVPYYAGLFQAAFGDPEITTEKIGKALGAFLFSITSTQTRFDLALQGKAQLTALEKAGQDLFITTYECNACHQIQSPHGYIFAGTFSNVGLDARNEDEGRGGITLQSADAGNFKIPSLRNVALTAPYMHDGRFETLNDVLEHYSNGIQDNPNLDTRLRQEGAPMRMQIPEHEKKAIIAFLNTLTDHAMIRDERFSNPFKAR